MTDHLMARANTNYCFQSLFVHDEPWSIFPAAGQLQLARGCLSIYSGSLFFGEVAWAHPETELRVLSQTER